MMICTLLIHTHSFTSHTLSHTCTLTLSYFLPFTPSPSHPPLTPPPPPLTLWSLPGPNRTISSLTHDAYCCAIYRPIMHPLDPPPWDVGRGRDGNSGTSNSGTSNSVTSNIDTSSIHNPRDYQQSQSSKVTAMIVPFPTERIDYEHCGQVSSCNCNCNLSSHNHSSSRPPPTHPLTPHSLIMCYYVCDPPFFVHSPLNIICTSIIRNTF